MKNIVRLIMLLTALGLYWLLIKDSEYTFMLILQIISVALLFIGMESARRKGEKIYQQNADIDIIDQMGDSNFKEYVAQLYKKLGYYIQPNRDPKKTQYDFIIIKDKKLRVIKCFKSEALVGLSQVTEAYELMQKVNKKDGIFITNQGFEEEAVEYLADKQVELVERRKLIQLVEQTVRRKYVSHETKVQET